MEGTVRPPPGHKRYSLVYSVDSYLLRIAAMWLVGWCQSHGGVSAPLICQMEYSLWIPSDRCIYPWLCIKRPSCCVVVGQVPRRLTSAVGTPSKDGIFGILWCSSSTNKRGAATLSEAPSSRAIQCVYLRRWGSYQDGGLLLLWARQGRWASPPRGDAVTVAVPRTRAMARSKYQDAGVLL